MLTADGGLAGAFNSNLIKIAQRFANEHKGEDLSFELIGRKGRDYFKKRYSNIAGEHLDVFRNVKFESAEKIVQAIIDRALPRERSMPSIFLLTSLRASCRRPSHEPGCCTR